MSDLFSESPSELPSYPVAERPSPPPSPWSPPSSPLAALGDAQIVALKVVGAVLLVVAVGVGLLLYDSHRGAADVAELRELAAGGGATARADTPASLWVNAEPIGATVLVDGDSVGTTPLWLESIAAGEHRVQILGPDGGQLDTTLSMASGAMVELDTQSLPNVAADVEAPAAGAVEIAEEPAAQTPPLTASARAATTGSLRVTSSPAGAVVLLDGRRMGTTPLELHGVQPGGRTVSVARGGYETTVQQIDVRPGVQFEAMVDLRPVQQAAAPPRPAAPPPEVPRPQVTGTGTVEILVRPWGRIAIDGETRQRESDTVYRTTLSAGPHQITVSHPQLGSDERAVTVQPGGVTRIEFDLTRGTDGN